MLYLWKMRAAAAGTGTSAATVGRGFFAFWHGAVAPAEAAAHRPGDEGGGARGREALYEVDMVVLRDLGLERSQIGSLLHEGLAECELAGLLREGDARSH